MSKTITRAMKSLSEEVNNFLLENPFLVTVLHDSIDRLGVLFDEDVKIVIGVEREHETFEERLIMSIVLDVDISQIKEMNRRMHVFDEFWITQDIEAQEKMLVVLDFE